MAFADCGLSYGLFTAQKYGPRRSTRKAAWLAGPSLRASKAKESEGEPFRKRDADALRKVREHRHSYRDESRATRHAC